MPVQLVSTEVFLRRLELRRADYHGLASFCEGAREKAQPRRLLEVLNDVAEKNQIVGRQLRKQPGCVADVNPIVEKPMHRREVSRVALDAVDAPPPVFALVARRLVLGFED